MHRAVRLTLACLPLAALAVPASAQDTPDGPAKRTRLILGPQLAPSWPGADRYSLGPYVDLSRSPEAVPFEFEAPDESFGSPLVHSGKFAFGPAFGFIGKRTPDKLGAPLPKVGLSVEAGAFAQMSVAPGFRVRAEARKALSGHKGWIGEVSADYVARQGDDWLFSIGPRVTLGDARYTRAYFGVAPADVAASGLTAFDPGGGVQSVGVTAGYLRQIGGNWGIALYARYDRLVGDAADSPVTRALGSRDQPSGGIALSYTFGGDR